MSMTPEAKGLLSKTIRSLRERLLGDLEDALSREYKLGVDVQKAKLSHEQGQKRGRLDAWVDEQVRALGPKAKKAEAVSRFRAEVVKTAAYTLLNRLVYLRLLEAAELRNVPLVTGGWKSRGYQDFRDLAPALTHDETEGYAFLLGQVFEELALDLPGLFGSAGMADLVPTPAATLRHVVESLDDTELASCWTDDMTLGWVYQYWNDPEREGLDTAVKESNHKIQRHEVAAKTQMFTDRYIADWLLQNSLGTIWFAMCAQNGWTPNVVSSGALDAMNERRASRARGEGSRSPELELARTDEERRWSYFLPTPLCAADVEAVPGSLRELKILDPAVGSGHLLVLAAELLFYLYREEAEHRGLSDDTQWSDAAIVERIFEHNLHGVDVDPRAAQIAGAALWLKARSLCPDAALGRLNLAAASLKLGDLPEQDPALVRLRRDLEHEAGLPDKTSRKLVGSLGEVDHLGSLAKLGNALDELIQDHFASRAIPEQGSLLGEAFADTQPRVDVSAEEARKRLETPIEDFLAAHAGAADLGIRLIGRQLAAGVSLMRILRDARYDLVVMNPPYHAASKLAKSATRWQASYPKGRADLFAAFVLRSFELLRPGGLTASVTLSNWMFLKAFAEFREWILGEKQLIALGDLGKGAFSSGSNLISASAQVFRNAKAGPGTPAVALRTFEEKDESTDANRPVRTSDALTYHEGRHEFDPAALKVVPEWPLVYWWSQEFLVDYERSDLLGQASPAKVGIVTGNNPRFVRKAHELAAEAATWVPYVSGAKGTAWVEPCSDRINWRAVGLETKALAEQLYGSHTRQVRNEDLYFVRGVACAAIGNNFSARIHRKPAIIGSSAASVFPTDPIPVLLLLNSSFARTLLSELNPGVHFEVGDINRVPIRAVPDAALIFRGLEEAFASHESHSEPSVEFVNPGASSWRSAQDWAQRAVDRAEGEPLPPYEEQLDPEPPTDHISFALGVSLGRFGPNGEGILDHETADLSHTLPAGTLFLDDTLDPDDHGDSLSHSAAERILAAWSAHAPDIDTKRKHLREYLRLDFFKDVHKGMYENRPIHWPLSSEKKTFVAWINIHRFDANTLRNLLAEHLNPTAKRLDGQLADLRQARDSGDAKASRDAEKRLTKLTKAREELAQFIADVEQCAERGPLPPDAKAPAREVDAAYDPDLDDGVMINSAALYPLLTPQWKDPKKWWKEMANAKGRKDYDWSHLAMRYWPSRVDAKCQEDPSLGVAHGCFWKYHPERAYAWELRLQDEIEPEFTIDEADSDACRAAFLKDHPDKAEEIRAKEAKRRERKAAKEAKTSAEAAASAGPLFDKEASA